MPANLENSVVATGLEKVSFHSNPKERQCSNNHTIALISQASKVIVEILQARPQQYVNFQMFKLVLEKADEPEIKFPTSAGSSKSKRVPEKHLISALLTMPKPLTVDHNKLWKILKKMGIPDLPDQSQVKRQTT